MTESFNTVHVGAGCTISYSSTSGGSYTVVGQMKSIGGTEFEMAMIDSTGLASTASEQVPNLIPKFGDYEFTCIYSAGDATQTAIAAAQAAGTLLYWKHAFSLPTGPDKPDVDTPEIWAFAAYVSKFATANYEVEDGIEATFTLAITGGVTLTAQAGS